MNHALYILLIGAALSLGIFGEIVNRGAQIVNLDRRLMLMALIWGTLALAETYVGYLGGRWLLGFDLDERDILFTHVLAGILLVGIGVRMFWSALARKDFTERRMEGIDLRYDAILGIRFCFFGLVAGVVFGLLEYSMRTVVLVIGLMAAGVTVAGYYAGRSYGIGISQRAYALGGALMCATGVLLQL